MTTESNVLFQTVNYRLEFTPEYDKTNADDGPYKVFYIPTNNVETSLSNYASAYELMFRFEDGLRQINKAFEDANPIKVAGPNVTQLIRKPN